MTDVVDWSQDSAREIIAEAQARLSAGQVIQLPTESVPIAAALAAPSVGTRLRGARAVALPHPYAVFDWLPYLRGSGKRLVEKYWPGPLTLAFAGGYESGVWAHLPEDVQRLLLDDNHLALRLVDHGWPGDLIPQLPAPLVAANASGQACDWIVRDETNLFLQPPTRARIGPRSVDIAEEGAIAGDQIRDASLARVLFVCTGNTCRSPMTASLCRKMLADHLGCAPNELAAHGFVVESAGLAASLGAPASPEAVRAVAKWGGVLAQHASQPVTEQLVTRADRIFTMTLTHERWLSSALRGLPVETLAPHRDIADPIGGDEAVYVACAEQIHAELENRLPEILEL